MTSRYARPAGFALLALSLIALGGSLVVPRIAEGATFADTARIMTAAARSYRLALLIQLLVPVLGALLAAALYATLKSVNGFLAQLALILYLEDAFLSWLVWLGSFVRLYLYTAPPTDGAGTMLSQRLVDLTRQVGGAAENAGGICFGIALLLFSALFFQSRLIPRLVSGLGLAGSAVWTALYAANVVFPEQHATFRSLSWPLMTLAIITLGSWLAIRGVRVPAIERRVP